MILSGTNRKSLHDKMSQLVKGAYSLSLKTEFIPATHLKWKERTDSTKLSSDLYICAVAQAPTYHVYTHTHTQTRKNIFSPMYEPCSYRNTKTLIHRLFSSNISIKFLRKLADFMALTS